MQGNVVADGAREEEDILKNGGYAPPEVRFSYSGNRNAIQEDFPLLRLIESTHQIHNGGFPGSRFSDECSGFPCFHNEIHVLENPVLPRVGKPDVPELDASRSRRHGRSLVGLFQNRFLLQQSENAVRRNQSGLDAVVLVRKIRDGAKELLDVAGECVQDADGQPLPRTLGRCRMQAA